MIFEGFHNKFLLVRVIDGRQLKKGTHVLVVWGFLQEVASNPFSPPSGEEHVLSMCDWGSFSLVDWFSSEQTPSTRHWSTTMATTIATMAMASHPLSSSVGGGSSKNSSKNSSSSTITKDIDDHDAVLSLKSRRNLLNHTKSDTGSNRAKVSWMFASSFWQFRCPYCRMNYS